MPRGTAHAPRERRRAEILQAALRCFAERGYHETTVDDVAASSGLSKGAIYWHFKGKREIFLELFDQYMGQLAADAAAAAGAASPDEALRRIGQAFVQAEPQGRALWEAALEYLAHATRDPELRARSAQIYGRYREIVERQIRRGIDEGSYQPVDAGSVAAGLIAALDGLLVQQLMIQEVDVERAWSETLEVLLRGLRRP